MTETLFLMTAAKTIAQLQNQDGNVHLLVHQQLAALFVEMAKPEALNNEMMATLLPQMDDRIFE